MKFFIGNCPKSNIKCPWVIGMEHPESGKSEFLDENICKNGQCGGKYMKIKEPTFEPPNLDNIINAVHLEINRDK